MTEPQALQLVVESLTRLEMKIDNMNARLDTKADKTDLAKLQGRMEGYESTLASVKAEIRAHEVADTSRDKERKDATERNERRREFVNKSFMAFCALASTFAVLYSSLH